MADPGWYPNPDDPSQVRYWDGAAWTHRILPDPGAAPSTTPGDRVDDQRPDDPRPDGTRPGDVRRARTARRRYVVVGLVAMVALALAAGGLTLVGTSESVAAEVILEPVDDAGPDPFFTSVALVSVEIEPGAVDDLAGGTRAVESLSGATPGLYGGTGDDTACDQSSLAEFLEGDPAKATAFAAVLGVEPESVANYVAALTPVLLREDTRVTNHGFVAGVATPHQAVLQAGTAVLIDEFGVPRVRCACGNPLLSAERRPNGVSYLGDPWPGFDARRLVTVTPAGQPQAAFEVAHIGDGELYSIGPGTTHGSDGASETDDVDQVAAGLTIEDLLAMPLPVPHGCAPGSGERLANGEYSCVYEDSFEGELTDWWPVLGSGSAQCVPEQGDDTNEPFGRVPSCSTSLLAVVGDLTGDGRNDGAIAVVHGTHPSPRGFVFHSVWIYSADGLPFVGSGIAGDLVEVSSPFHGITGLSISDGTLEVTGWQFVEGTSLAENARQPLSVQRWRVPTDRDAGDASDQTAGVLEAVG
ncbi:MAG: DUF2510 domain-containing protein [Acidimicrobiia bacterium]|nr:DUF2510 domain-containing protein [Acidimicrobiia bacterium]